MSDLEKLANSLPQRPHERLNDDILRYSAAIGSAIQLVMPGYRLLVDEQNLAVCEKALALIKQIRETELSYFHSAFYPPEKPHLASASWLAADMLVKLIGIYEGLPEKVKENSFIKAERAGLDALVFHKDIYLKIREKHAGKEGKVYEPLVCSPAGA